MANGSEPLFLAKDSYRRRRVADAAKLMPIFGFVLLALAGLMTTTTTALIYIFTIWAILIALMGVLSRSLITSDGGTKPEVTPDPTDTP